MEALLLHKDGVLVLMVRGWQSDFSLYSRHCLAAKLAGASLPRLRSGSEISGEDGINT